MNYHFNMSEFRAIGASNHAQHSREENDYYATDPVAIDKLFDNLTTGYFSEHIWEPACGEGHLSKRMMERGKIVRSTDLMHRGCGLGGTDFVEQYEPWGGDIITNPPYSLAEKFVRKSLELVSVGCKVAMFLRIQFLEGIARKEFFSQYPPRYVLVFSKRVKCAINGDFENTGASAACYAWFVWEKGYAGATEVRWL